MHNWLICIASPKFHKCIYFAYNYPFFLLFTFAFQLVGYDFWNCIVEACLILLYFESQKSHKCIYSTNYCVHLVSPYIFIHICITAFQWVWVELLEPYYWSMFPIVVAKLAQQMKGGFHLLTIPLSFLFCLPVLYIP